MFQFRHQIFDNILKIADLLSKFILFFLLGGNILFMRVPPGVTSRDARIVEYLLPLAALR